MLSRPSRLLLLTGLLLGNLVISLPAFAIRDEDSRGGTGSTEVTNVCCACRNTTTGGQGLYRFNGATTCSDVAHNASFQAGIPDTEFANIQCSGVASCVSPLAGEQLSALVQRSTVGTQTTPPPPERPFQPVTPELGVAIPGVTLGAAARSGNNITVPFLGQYIAGWYRYALSIVGLVATIMVVYGGFRYLMGSATSDIAAGKKIMVDAITGMILVFGAYTLLATVNPETLSLQPLVLNEIVNVPLEQLLLENGSDASDSLYSQQGTAALTMGSEADTGLGRSMNQACGQKDGPALTGREAQTARLVQIITAWKQFGIDQGGAVYVRGGTRTCSNTAEQMNNLINDGQRHIHVMINAFKAAEGQVQLTFSPVCQASIRVFQDAQTADQRNNVDLHVPECRQEYADNYARIIERFHSRGLFCSDCIGFTRYIYSCFGYHDTARRICPGGVSGCRSTQHQDERAINRGSGTWRNNTELEAFVNNLRFGDVIALMPSHIILYTGKSSLPYEIMEMGCVGANASGNVLAQSSSQTMTSAGFRTGGMCVSRSALNYLRALGPTITEIRAWNPLEQGPDQST